MNHLKKKVSILTLLAFLFLALFSTLPFNTIKKVQATTIFTNGFEEGQCNPAPGVWTTNQTTATYGFLEVQSTTKHHGTYALNATITSQVGWTQARAEKTIAEQSEVYIHLNLYVDAISGTYYMRGFAVFGGSSWQQARLGITKDRELRLLYRNASADTDVVSTTTIDLDTWTEIEMGINVSETVGSIKVWKNDVIVADLTKSDLNNLDGGNINNIVVGVMDGNELNAMLYVDCVTVATTKIGLEGVSDLGVTVMGYSSATNGSNAIFRTQWNGTGSHYIFSSNNTDTMTNGTTTSCVNTWTNETITLNSSLVVVQWGFYINNTEDTWFFSGWQNLTLTPLYSFGAETGSASHIQAGISNVTAEGGGNIYVPYGTFHWTGEQVTYSGSVDINIMGYSQAGVQGHSAGWANNTATTKIYNDVYTATHMFYFGGQGHNPFVYGTVTFSNIELGSVAPDNATQENVLADTSTGVYMRQIPDYRIHHTTFINFSGNAIYLDSNDGSPTNVSCYGVVDHCFITAPYKTTDPISDQWIWAYGIGVRGEAHNVAEHWSSTNAPVTDFYGQYGYRQWFTIAYIEDNHFKYNRHSLACSALGYYVARFNLFDEPACAYQAGLTDVHGEAYPSGRGSEVYNNTFYGAPENGKAWDRGSSYYSNAVVLRGGSSLVYYNSFTCLKYSQYNYFLMLSEDWTGNYPWMTVNQTYIWLNTYTNCTFLSNVSPINVTENNNYFLRQPTFEQDGFSYSSYMYPHPLVSEEESEDNPPSWVIYGANTTLRGMPCLISSRWADDNGLSHYITEHNNTGTLANTTVAFSTNPDWGNHSFTLNDTIGVKVAWRIHANDSIGQWSVFSWQYIIVTGKLISSNVYVDQWIAGKISVFTCDWTSDFSGLSFGILSHNSSGSWQNRTALSLSGYSDTFTDSFTLNTTRYLVIGYRFYANNTLDYWNSTSIYTFTTTYAEGWVIYTNLLGIQPICVEPDKNYFVLLTTSSGMINSSVNTLNIQTRGYLSFSPEENVVFTVDFNGVSVTVEGDQDNDVRRIDNGTSITGLTGNIVRLSWDVKVPELNLPIMPLMGIGGFVLIGIGGFYVARKVRERDILESIRALLWAIMVVLIGVGLIIGWLW